MRITLTGIDEHTDLLEVRRRLLHNPVVEIGILATESPDGRPRYPSHDFIAYAASYLAPRCSIHFCGSRIRDRLLNGRGSVDGWFGDHGARRLQVNGTITGDHAIAICLRYWRLGVITQHTAANAALLADAIGPNHQLLVDGSGGRGLVPPCWVAPVTTKPVGYAGGLGPRTLPFELPKIASIAHDGAWIDMESSLRDGNDRFDIGLAEAAIHAFNQALVGCCRSA